MELTITSLNVQGFFGWQGREEHITDYLQKIHPDIIFLQEVTYIPEISPYTQATQINEVLHYPYEHSSISRLQKSPQFEHYREGLSVLSKYPIMKSEVLVLKQDPEDEHLRLVQFIDIRKDDGTVVKLANIHFSITDNTEKFARGQLEEVLQILASRGEERIIGGDFNMKQLERHSDLWSVQYLASSRVPYITYPSENKRMDYFLIPKILSFTDITTSPDGLSDHRALSIAANELQSQQDKA
jgi:endonuclease/exonuclease/phosphatase family metal-dependent hydrolase